jgi:hypothetical protein
VAKRTRKETSGREIVPVSTAALIPRERIERSILFLRGEKVMLDADLAALYGVTTRRLNEQVRRNWERFPSDFFFQLTAEEKAEVVANCDHLTRMRFSSALPLAFKLGSLEKKCDAEFEQVYDTIRALMTSPEDDFSKKDRIGFDGVEAS